MRENLPVTQREHPFPEGATLMSVTDLDSRIAYCNNAFIEVSGFSRDELMGQPHNIVRHPDMPRAAFADMWATLKAGDSWTALVKNRRKDGDHYWVRANVTPVRRGGRVTGYMSVRTQPRRDEVAHAEALYRRMREGRAHGLALRKGILVRTGALAWMSLLKQMPVRWRLRCGVAVAAVVPAAAAAWSVPAAAVLAGAAAAAASALAGWWLERQIASPLRQVLSQAKSVAAGQPQANIQLDRIDEIGMLMRAINQAGLNLRALIDDVDAQVSGMQTASSEIAMGNNDLSSRTEEAASNLQQTAASMEQMNATVRNNEAAAHQAAELAASASRVATEGGEVVGRVVTTMEDITGSSRRIADIIGVIDGIAFQTNILALNAAVEAARAGEQGRGFAVVAGEVRSLAQRSAEAAKEIKVLIGASVERVETGSRLVGDAGRTMADVVEQVRRVSQFIREISAASAEQSTGIGQVGAAVTQLDQMTQQNAALVEQSAAAAESLKHQALRLSEAVGVYAR